MITQNLLQIEALQSCHNINYWEITGTSCWKHLVTSRRYKRFSWKYEYQCFATRKIVSKCYLVHIIYWDKFVHELIFLRFSQVLDKFLKLNSRKTSDLSICGKNSRKNNEKKFIFIIFYAMKIFSANFSLIKTHSH